MAIFSKKRHLGVLSVPQSRTPGSLSNIFQTVFLSECAALRYLDNRIVPSLASRG